MEVYGWCLDDPVNLVDPLGLEANIPSIEEHGVVPPYTDKAEISLNAAGLGGEAGIGLYVSHDSQGNNALGWSAKAGASSDFGFGPTMSYEQMNANSVDQPTGWGKYNKERVGPVEFFTTEGEGYNGNGVGISNDLSKYVVPAAAATGVEYSQNIVKWKDSRPDTRKESEIRERH